VEELLLLALGFGIGGTVAIARKRLLRAAARGYVTATEAIGRARESAQSRWRQAAHQVWGRCAAEERRSRAE